MIKTVIFDLDNTLYDYDASHQFAFRALTAYATRELDISPEAFLPLHEEANRLLIQRTGGNCAAMHSRLLRYQILLERLGKPLFHAPRMEQLYWSTLLEHAVPSPGALDCLTRLKAAGIRLGVGTDMTAGWQYLKLERLGLLPLFDFIVCSEEASAEKPDPRFFRLCLEKAGCRAEECAFVGDSLPKDALGGRHAGMRAFWYRPQADCPPLEAGVACIRRLDALPGLLL